METIEKDEWIKINSIGDLPIESGKYKVVIKDRNLDYGSSWWIEEYWRDEMDSEKWLRIYSHYKPIEDERFPID
ncbi:hypothetical protein [Chryseobacterium aquifrigidense]|uniref:Uncharacterized protein n=1 Tax=Chryseobacterium aquifrigidense TaxID=558021 RepID=A0A543E9S5_9FLAO|nr:hypothetical protein [Chryseobacterium aquifrigidense]TQM18354.1 hypothetical protein FB551_4135 [Chryseobacterium aquifrigidense]